MKYQGQKPMNDETELCFPDDDGPIMVYLPREGIKRLCGQEVSDADFDTIVLAHEKELYPLIDRACERQGGFAIAVFENGVKFRKLQITLEDIESSGIKLSTDVLAIAAVAQFTTLPV
jgi:hypothetical protein